MTFAGQALVVDDDVGRFFLRVGGSHKPAQAFKIFPRKVVEVQKFVGVKSVVVEAVADGAFNPRALELLQKIVGV